MAVLEQKCALLAVNDADTRGQNSLKPQRVRHFRVHNLIAA